MADPGWTHIPARWQYPDRGGHAVIWVVLHSMEVPCRPGVAASVGRAFSTSARKASTHVGADPAGVVRYVADDRGCYGAEGNSNRRGWHVEQAGYASTARPGWLSGNPLAMIGHAARAVAYACGKYKIPPRMLADKEVRSFTPGVVTHAQLTRVYTLRGGHWDPGPGYPADVLLAKVREHLGAPPLAPVADPGREGNRFRGFPTVGLGDRDDPARVPAARADPRLVDAATPVLTLQTWLNWTMQAQLYGDGVYGGLTEGVVRHFQRWWRDHGLGLAVDGVCGPQTWSQLDVVADIQKK